MQLPQIRMQQTHVKLGLSIERSEQQIRQQKADVNIRQKPPELSIRQPKGKLNIDQTQAWNDQNLKSPFKLTEDWARQGYQRVMAAIATIAREGDRMARIESGENAIAAIAKSKTLKPPADFNYGVMPEHGSVNIRYRPQSVKYQFSRGNVELDVKSHQPKFNYIPGKMDMSIRQQNNLSIWFVGLNVDKQR